jgi:hypothetical protein
LSNSRLILSRNAHGQTGTLILSRNAHGQTGTLMKVIDLVAANEVIPLLDVHSYDPEVPVIPDPDKLTVITGPEPLVALAHMGLVLMETEEGVD